MITAAQKLGRAARMPRRIRSGLGGGANNGQRWRLRSSVGLMLSNCGRA